jgi:hypothetical protein
VTRSSTRTWAASAWLLPYWGQGVALGVALGDVLAPVVLLSTAGETHADLGPAVLEVEGEGDDRQSLAVDPARPGLELVAVSEELAAAVVVVGERRARVRVGRDVEADQPEFSLEEDGVGVLELDLAFAQRLDLAALQHETELDLVEDVVVAARDAVGRDGGGAGRDVPLLLRLGHPTTVPGPPTGSGRLRVGCAESSVGEGEAFGRLGVVAGEVL